MLSSDEENKGGSKSKRKVTVNKKTLDQLQVKCEWFNCAEALRKSKYEFYRHVSDHLRDADIIGLTEDEEEIYKCRWSNCNFETKDSYEITRHVKYHAYHAELRALGKHVSQVLNLPPCVILNEFNVLNNVEDAPHVCLWIGNCNSYTAGIQEFIDHVHFHIRSLSSKQSSYECLWSDCNSVFQTKSKLADHMKTHTKQHFIACPQCGHTFANKAKFVDHCLTQKPFDEHVFQCDYCLTFHPSERLLRKHMGQHIHHYKCPFCNMTCNKPSLLAKHIRYRHLNYKSFTCSLCETKKFKSKHDLQSHVLTHVKEVQFCQESNCNFASSSQAAMKRHIEQNHELQHETGLFCCHICDKKYKKGAKLTKHLGMKHNLKKPPGYSRFLYRLESDGNKRLQTVRLESLEIHEMAEYDSNSGVEDPNETDGSESPYQAGESASKAITVDVLSAKGEVVSSSIVIPEDASPPVNAEVIAVGE